MADGKGIPFVKLDLSEVDRKLLRGSKTTARFYRLPKFFERKLGRKVGFICWQYRKHLPNVVRPIFDVVMNVLAGYSNKMSETNLLSFFKMLTSFPLSMYCVDDRSRFLMDLGVIMGYDTEVNRSPVEFAELPCKLRQTRTHIARSAAYPPSSP